MTAEQHLGNVASSRWPATRYRTLRTDPDARRALRTRAAVSAALRELLNASGFVEVDTPVLQPATTAFTSRPFRVHTRALPGPVFLRNSPLYLRGMLTAGFDRVYEIGRSFRDEPLDGTHSPEYTLVEVYQGHADYLAMRGLVRTLVQHADRAAAATGGLAARDLEGDWPSVDVYEAVGTAVGHPVSPSTSIGDLRDLGAAASAPVPDIHTADEALLHLYDRLVEPATVRPTFYLGFPASCSPLAESEPSDVGRAQKWDLVIRGTEVATAYTELTDPVELRRRVERSSTEADTIDEDMLAVFDLGMPAPSGGLCIGLDRLVLTLTGAATVHEVIPIPLIAPNGLPPGAAEQ